MKRALLKSILIVGCAMAMTAGYANAASYSFEDLIDTWGGLGAAWIGEGHPLTYTHDLNQEVNFAKGHKVTAATLELDFTNDSGLFGLDGSDCHGSIFNIKWDFREFAKVGFNGVGWQELGEVDNGQYDLVLDIDWLNDDGMLDVTLKVYNPLGVADAWLDHSRLYGTAETPEPAAMLLFGSGLVGLAGLIRRKQK